MKMKMKMRMRMRTRSRVKIMNGCSMKMRSNNLRKQIVTEIWLFEQFANNCSRLYLID